MNIYEVSSYHFGIHRRGEVSEEVLTHLVSYIYTLFNQEVTLSSRSHLQMRQNNDITYNLNLNRKRLTYPVKIHSYKQQPDIIDKCVVYK